MKKLAKLLFLVLIATSVAFVGCNRDDDDNGGGGTTPTPSFEILKTYVTSNSLDLSDILPGFFISATDVNAKGADLYNIIDLRGQTDFDAGHIADAVRSDLKDVITTANAMFTTSPKPFLVVCYTGQTAGHAVVALRLSGYADAKLLLFGMAGWSSLPQFSDSWSTKTGDAAIGNPSWIVPPGAITTNATFADPTFTSTLTDGGLLLEERVDYMLNRGFLANAISNADVLGSPDNYFINNYWADTDVITYGNITGAYRINPLSFGGGEYLNLDASKTVVTYCWTGQTSSMITAYLTVMGYDAKTLTFGANGMIYTNLTAHKYSLPGTDYPTVP